ncbi:MAG: DMT family transporter [Desulfovibrio sp.]|nr:DMT family transporter [Desulfovibrio sp.]
MRTRALALMIACYVGWGGGAVAMKLALESFSVLQVMTARVAVPALLYLVLWRRWTHPAYRRGDWKWLALAVACEPCLFFFCMTSAMRFTTASEAGVITALLPLATALGAWLCLKEKLPGRAVTGLVIALPGIVGLNLFSAGRGGAPAPLLGNALALAAILFSAGYTLCIRRLAERYSGLFLSALQALGGSLVFAPLCLLQPAPAQVRPEALGALAYLGFGIGILVYLGFNYSLRWVKAGLAGALANITPLVTLATAALLLGERLHPAQLAFAGVALAGTAVATGAFLRAKGE